jgi:hypothetical protein
LAFLGIEEVDEFADGGSKTLDGALGGFAQERFPFGEGVLDGMEVGAMGRLRRAGLHRLMFG